MNKKAFTRLTAVLLAVLMVCSAFTFQTLAAEGDTATAQQSDANQASSSLQSITEELQTIDYSDYLLAHADAAVGKKDFTVNAVKDYLPEKTDADVKTVKNSEYDGGSGESLSIGDSGTVVWKVEVPSTGRYAMELTYYPIKNKATSIERKLTINGELPFAEARYLSFTKVWKEQYQEDGGFQQDSTGSDVRPAKIEDPEWRTISVYDADGIYTTPLEFYFEAGENEIALESIREPIIIKSIRFYPVEVLPTYAEVLAEYESKGYQEVSAEATLKIQAEKPEATSDQTVYPIYDRTSAITEPQDPAKIRINTIGADKWQTPGQWIRYKVTPTETGLYTIVIRFKQSLLEGMFTSRRLYINGAIPFQEAGSLRFNFADEWQVDALGNGEVEYQFYFEAGKEYELAYEVCMGDLGEITNRVSRSVSSLNNDYLKIIQLTGNTPDEYRDYGFSRILPNTIKDLVIQRDILEEILNEINVTSGMKGSQVTTIEDIVRLLGKMTSSEDEIAKSLTKLKTYIGNLSTWLLSARNQPLEIDYFVLQGASQKKPQAVENFWQSTWHEVKSFIASFFNDYTSMGSSDDTQGESVVVWVSSDRDRARIIRTLIDNDFTPNDKYTVDLKLVAGGSLLPSVLAGVGPDVSPAMAATDVINYAIRGAIIPLQTNQTDSEYYNRFEGIDEVLTRFDESAIIPLSFRGTNADGKYIDDLYALPETQDFPMLFYRKDVLADLDVEVPQTWDDMLALIPILQYNNMEIGMPKNYRLFLYQSGGELWADEGMRINLDANESLESFAKMCNMFTQYSLPYDYEFANRFRTGEMPVGVGDYVALYNKLTIFATEIRGLWGFAQIPGTVREDGTVDHTAVSSVTGVVMMRGAKHLDGAWKFMDWYTDTYFQQQYANELTAIVGPAAKIATANKDALEEMSWSSSELENIKIQYEELATIPEYPGGYIIERYADFAFAAAYNDGKDPVESLLGYITFINKEITRKRKEFNLETLEIGQTLAEKRAEQAAAGE